MSAHDLELIRLRKVYPGGTVAVEGFDLQVERGEFISFVGPSGCGKTTSLRMMAGLESVTSGELLIRGQNVTNVPAERRPTATIFQNYAIFPHMTVWENIAFGLRVRKLPEDEIRRRVDAIVEKLELGDVVHAKERSLAGGHKQRMALARGLVTEPEILLLDEPLGALDANLRKSIQEELKILQRDLNMTFVFVTHAQSEALSMGDRVVVMNSGRVEQISVPYELYTRPQTPFVARFIGRNYIIDGTLGEVRDGHATVVTRFGALAGLASPRLEGIKPGDPAFLVVPSEFVELSTSGEPAPEASESIPGTISEIDIVGRVAHVSVVLDEHLSVRLESYRDKLTGRGIEPGAQVDLRWMTDAATVVAEAP